MTGLAANQWKRPPAGCSTEEYYASEHTPGSSGNGRGSPILERIFFLRPLGFQRPLGLLAILFRFWSGAWRRRGPSLWSALRTSLGCWAWRRRGTGRFLWSSFRTSLRCWTRLRCRSRCLLRSGLRFRTSLWHRARRGLHCWPRRSGTSFRTNCRRRTILRYLTGDGTRTLRRRPPLLLGRGRGLPSFRATLGLRGEPLFWGSSGLGFGTLGFRTLGFRTLVGLSARGHRSRGTRGRSVIRGRERAGRYQRRRTTAASRCRKLRTIRRGFPRMLHLSGNRGCPPIANHCCFLRRGTSFNSASSTVVAHPAAPALRNAVVVNILNSRRVYIRHRAVVIHPAVVPVSSVVATAGISETVIDAAVVADMRTPVARVPVIVAVVEAPPGRCPERTHIRRQNPSSGNPVITGVRITPVAGRPNVVVAGSGRLAVIRKRRRWFGSFYRLIVGSILIVVLSTVRIAGRGCEALPG